MPKTASARQARHWCFTLNHPESDLDLTAVPDLRYGIYQHESGEEGTDHFQGYLEFSCSKRLSWLKNNFSDRAHYEPRRGTRDQARDYCRKTETQLVPPVEFGNWSAGAQGTRTDVSALKETIDSGATLKEVWSKHSLEFLKYTKGIQLATTLCRNSRRWKMEVTLLVGPTGTGKTKYVHDHEQDNLYQKSPDKWWDGYDGQEAILIDDFYGWLPYHYMLQLLDRYPLNLEVKGGTTPCLAKRVYITSNKLPTEWWTGTDKYTSMESIQALLRRIDIFLWVPTFENYQRLDDFQDLEFARNTANLNF